MLQAFCHRKSRQYQRYLGHRDGGEVRVSEEDEITSLIMGPLEYLPAPDVGRFWQALVEPFVRTSDLPFPSTAVERATLHFWQRRSVEPDLLVELFWASGESRLLLIEFKWKAPLSGPDQLHRQWQEFLTPAEQQRAYHLFIAPDISSGLNAMGRDNLWNGRLIIHSWLSVLSTLRLLDSSGASGLTIWRDRVTRFLKLLGIEKFRGFCQFKAPATLSTTPIFWSRIDGFLAIAPPCLPILVDHPTGFIWSFDDE